MHKCVSALQCPIALLPYLSLQVLSPHIPPIDSHKPSNVKVHARTQPINSSSVAI